MSTQQALKQSASERLKKEFKTLMQKYKVKCEKRTFEDSNGNYETIDVLVGGKKINHRYEIFTPVKDIFL